MNSLISPKKELWFVTGSQHLYGPETLKEVDAHSKIIADALNAASNIPVKVVFKPVLTTPEAITQIALEANSDANCIGLIAWMHTFSPAKMWIGGLTALSKPLCHLHTQFNRDIPWATMDMDFMNLNQSAHGGREFGFMVSRLRINRKIIVGHWEDPEVVSDLAQWSRVAAAWDDFKHLKVVRFGDNMRQVAVTEGDKVEAQIKFGMSVNSHGIGDLVEHVRAAKPADVEALCEVYAQNYKMAPELLKGGARYSSLQDTAAIELGLRSFMEEGGFGAFVDSFEDLHGLKQLPGLPAQRLMADGYGFGAEGDWKHSALTRAMKVMASGIDKGTSFMEDYTYHFSPNGARCLGAHMLEICPSIADAKPSCEIHPLGIGGKEDPVRLVFNGKAGDAINASIVDMGNRFRLLINKVEAVEPEADLPKLPVARVLWDVKPSLKEGVACWIQAGGAHHTCFSYSVPTESMVDFAEMADIESVVIDEQTTLTHLKETLRCNEVYYGIKGL
jgi:L-arabinose isomerase